MHTEPATSLADELVELGLAGRIPNSRQANLSAIDRMLQGQSFYTFGIRIVEEAIAMGLLDREGVIGIMAQDCGCTEAEFLQDPGYIGPIAAAANVGRMAGLLAKAVSKGWTVALGTGHPGAMLGCYTRLAQWLASKGCPIAPIPKRATAGVDWFVDALEGVVITSDGCGILHGHATRPMETVLAQAEVDLVVGDHGHAGAAINAGLPCAAIMDTNDPALAVAGQLQAPHLVVVPLYDNRPNSTTRHLADILIRLAESWEARPASPEVEAGRPIEPLGER
ncbi:MAG: phosphatase [Cyanobacteria bacterium REEB65]|nr:phosphatase [Cyanobacteria bacterium REEB65]